MNQSVWYLLIIFILLVGCSTSSNENDSFRSNSNNTNAYLATFFEGTPQEVKALVYEVKLDTANISLIDGKKTTTLKGILDTATVGYEMLTNAGMFHANGEAVGLLIDQKGKQQPLNKEQSARGNFFLVPNGVFYVDTTNQAHVLETQQFVKKMQGNTSNLKLATQSGPMLLIDGAYHPKFNQNSSNTNIRNGVGVTSDQTIIFICTTQPTNLYNFASIFKEKECHNALYLDGFISSMYINGQDMQMNKYKQQLYGPIIGVRVK